MSSKRRPALSLADVLVWCKPMPTILHRSRVCLAVSLLLSCIVGCAGEPSWGIPANPAYKQTHIQSLIAPKAKIRIWLDHRLPEGTVLRTGPDTGQINPSQDDQRPGFAWNEKLKDGRVLGFRCLTRDGAAGTIAFTLDGKPFPEDKPFQLSNGRLFLVATKSTKVLVRQLDREIRDASSMADLEEAERVDPRISAFVAEAEKSK